MSKKISIKSNELVQNFKSTYNLWELKAISYICSVIYDYTKNHEFSIEHQFSFEVSDFLNDCGVSSCGDTYASLKVALKTLENKSDWVRIDNGEGRVYETRLAWILKSSIEKGTVYFVADPDMIPFINNLHKNFTKIDIENILKLKSANAIKLYEILKSYEYRSGTEFTPDHLMFLLGCDENESYKKNKNDFKSKVLDRACDEINAKTDIVATLETLKDGKTIYAFRFNVEKRG